MPITQLSSAEDFVAEFLKAWKQMRDTPPDNANAVNAARHHLIDLARLASETGNERAVRFMLREAVLVIAQEWREDHQYSKAELDAQAELEESVRQTVRNGHLVGRFILQHLHHHG